jgi:hypothetical protein
MRPLNWLIKSEYSTGYLLGENRMKSLRQFCITAALTFALTVSSFAGQMATGAIPPPPPEPPAENMSEIVTGVAVTDETGIETAFIDPITGIALNILQSVLALF